jgi:hypothetical protein
MPGSPANPFAAEAVPAAGAPGLRPRESAALAALVAGAAEPLLVEGCGSGCGLSHFLVEATAPWPSLPARGPRAATWAGLRATAETPASAARVVPALAGRWLAAAVRCGDIPSTDPELAAHQCEHETGRILDFHAPSPGARWLVAEAAALAPVLARHSRLGPDGPAWTAAVLDWAAHAPAGPRGWRLPGGNDEDAAAGLARAAAAAGLPLLWVFDQLDELALMPGKIPELWSRLAALAAAGGRIVLGCQAGMWREHLAAPLPEAWQRRFAARRVRLAPLPADALVALLDARLAATGAILPGFAAHVVRSSFPLGGLPLDALNEASAAWAARHCAPLAPAATPTTPRDAVPGDADFAWIEALLAAARLMPFVDAVPLRLGDRVRAVAWQLPGQWVVILAPPLPDPATLAELAETATTWAAAAAPAGTRVHFTALAAPGQSACPPPAPWQLASMHSAEAAALLDLPRVSDAERPARLAGLQNLVERLTRPPQPVP